MKIEALVSFAGIVTMAKGDIRDVSNDVGNDLIKAGYAKKVQNSGKKTVKADEI